MSWDYRKAFPSFGPRIVEVKLRYAALIRDLTLPEDMRQEAERGEKSVDALIEGVAKLKYELEVFPEEAKETLRLMYAAALEGEIKFFEAHSRFISGQNGRAEVVKEVLKWLFGQLERD